MGSFCFGGMAPPRAEECEGQGRASKAISSLGVVRFAESLVKGHFGVSGDFGPSCPGAVQTGATTRSLLGLEPQAKHGEMRDPCTTWLSLGASGSRRPSAPSDPLLPPGPWTVSPC